MTTITLPRAVVEQALEALEILGFGLDPKSVLARDLAKRIDALRAALAQEQAEPAQEPVAWRTFDGEGGYDYRTYEDNDSYAAEWTQRNLRHIGWVEPLHTAPPKPEPVDTDCHAQGICQRSGYGIGKQAEPLTEEEILRVKGQFGGTMNAQFVDFARAVERAHGIGNKK